MERGFIGVAREVLVLIISIGRVRLWSQFPKLFFYLFFLLLELGHLLVAIDHKIDLVGIMVIKTQIFL